MQCLPWRPVASFRFSHNWKSHTKHFHRNRRAISRPLSFPPCNLLILLSRDMMASSAVCHAIFGLLVGTCLGRSHRSQLERRIEFSNESGRNIVIEWVNPKTGILVPLSDPHVVNGERVSLDSCKPFVCSSFLPGYHHCVKTATLIVILLRSCQPHLYVARTI